MAEQIHKLGICKTIVFKCGGWLTLSTTQVTGNCSGATDFLNLSTN